MHDTQNFTVTVDLGIALARHVTVEQYKQAKINMQLQQPITLQQLIMRLGIPPAYIGFIAVNGERRSWDVLLEPNDSIVLIPYITGG
ncbi:MAG TPA: MoaD/ThiS family protein [Desulfotomaculum sp.]|nr:MAG: hypothetical protein VR67_11240 [Peptococcaceae bacterium BRH_c8a]KJS75898.1 MAG: hypothetical protein JL56_06570 [Desulfotomaculum sp. BICA1-6]HBX23458.1 MoaD/ThiS family protein [Desulfotomaculum sp.]